MMRLRQIYWLAPASMLSALIAGVLFAIGHHLFYCSIANTEAGSTSLNVLGSSVSRQATSIAIGTAFAFLVKLCLVYAVAVAYVQVFWYDMKTGNPKPTLATLDATFSGTRQLLVLFNYVLWMRYPILLLVALTAWYYSISMHIGGQSFRRD